MFNCLLHCQTADHLFLTVYLILPVFCKTPSLTGFIFSNLSDQFYTSKTLFTRFNIMESNKKGGCR